MEPASAAPERDAEAGANPAGPASGGAPAAADAVGGGRPRTAQLLIAADAAVTVNRLGIAVTAGVLLSPPVELLWEGENSYVIRLPAPRQRAVVQISHDLVEGVVTGQALTPLGTPTPT